MNFLEEFIMLYGGGREVLQVEFAALNAIELSMVLAQRKRSADAQACVPFKMMGRGGRLFLFYITKYATRF